jgi:hypothetical protein
MGKSLARIFIMRVTLKGFPVGAQLPAPRLGAARVLSRAFYYEDFSYGCSGEFISPSS